MYFYISDISVLRDRKGIFVFTKMCDNPNSMTSTSSGISVLYAAFNVTLFLIVFRVTVKCS